MDDGAHDPELDKMGCWNGYNGIDELESVLCCDVGILDDQCVHDIRDSYAGYMLVLQISADRNYEHHQRIL